MTPATRLRLVAIAGDVSTFLTIVAAIPYELGAAAEMLPPIWKQRIVAVGVFATLALRLLKRFMPPADTAKTIAVVLIAAGLFSGCAGSGEGGAWTPSDTAAAAGAINSTLGAYDRYQHPEYYRPSYAVPGAVLVP